MTATAIIIFILAVLCIGETLALADLWGRVAMLERFTYGKTKRSETK